MNQDQDIWMRVGGSDKTEQQIANLRQLTLILYILYASCWILGGLPAIVVYLVSYALGAESATAAFVALGFSVLLLGVVGYYGARRAGSPTRAAVIEGIGAGLLAVLIVAAKAGLH